jgi:hypothetical protein
MNTCTEAFERLAGQVGGIDCHASGLLSFRSPFSLPNGMAVIEALLVAGAAAGLVHAIRWMASDAPAASPGFSVACGLISVALAVATERLAARPMTHAIESLEIFRC